MLLRIEKFFKSISVDVQNATNKEVVWQRALDAYRASWAARVSCFVSHALTVNPAAPGHPPGGQVVHDSNSGRDGGEDTDPIAELEERINSIEFKEEYAKLFPGAGEDFTPQLDFMRKVCSDLRDLPNDPAFTVRVH